MTPLSALALATLGGCAVFGASLPWGDPCTFHGYAGGPCPSYVDDVPLGGLRNAAFLAICLGIGFAASKLSPSYRPLVGAVSVPLAGFSAGALAHVLLRLDKPFFTPPSSGYEWVTGLGYLAVLPALGVIGAVAAMWSPNIRSRRR